MPTTHYNTKTCKTGPNISKQYNNIHTIVPADPTPSVFPKLEQKPRNSRRKPSKFPISTLQIEPRKFDPATPARLNYPRPGPAPTNDNQTSTIRRKAARNREKLLGPYSGGKGSLSLARCPVRCPKKAVELFGRQSFGVL
uniref:Uncharacterized protein n=1 Tax=Solanum tuberosum TaxID=4113 RepID=M1D8B1_SOLTU